MTDQLQKAAIYNVDKGGSPIVCMFNPKEYKSQKQNTWQDKMAKGENVPHIEFGGGQPSTLQMQLFFDTYATGEDVREKYTNAIWELMLVDESLKDHTSTKSRPPIVQFRWGEAWYFDAVITSISQTFSLFLGDGKPVRATLDVTFRQIKDNKRFGLQNPTSGGEAIQRQWEVKAGDTLAWIAYKEYGDSNEWRRIADANRLTDLRRLRSGQMLEIPNA
jgi:nucleoid-associated protein YgaU